jgi:hypothetical protein
MVVAGLVMGLMGACGQKTVTQLVEVTRITQEPGEKVVVTVEVDRPVEVTRVNVTTQQVEVTRLVEVTKLVEVEKEVTREVLVEPAATPVPTEASSQFTFYQIGDVVEIIDRKITLNTVQLTDGTVTANFTVENIGTQVVSMNLAQYEFMAKDSAGTKLEYDYGCREELGGDLVPDDSVRGNLCWQGASGNNFKFQYSFYDKDLNTVITVWSVTIE